MAHPRACRLRASSFNPGMAVFFKISESRIYGQGIAVGDDDNDGRPDILRDHNFTDVTEKEGLAASGWRDDERT